MRRGRSRATTTPARSRSPRRSSGRSATTTSRWSSRGATATMGRRQRRRRTRRCCARCRCSTGCSLPICRSSPRRCGRGGSPARCIERHGRTPAEIDRLGAPDADARRALDAAIDVLGEIRRVKSIEKRPLKARIDVAVVRWSDAAIGLLAEVEADVRTAGGVERFEYSAGRRPAVDALTFATEHGGPGEPRA